MTEEYVRKIGKVETTGRGQSMDNNRTIRPQLVIQLLLSILIKALDNFCFIAAASCAYDADQYYYSKKCLPIVPSHMRFVIKKN